LGLQPLVDQAGLFDVRALCPARAAVDVAVVPQGLPASHDMDCIRQTEDYS
jgi:hypothetical protein